MEYIGIPITSNCFGHYDFIEKGTQKIWIDGYLNIFTTRFPYGIANSFVAIVQNKCGKYVVSCSYLDNFDNCIFLENNAEYGFDTGSESDAVVTVTNSYVGFKTKTGSGKLVLNNIRNDVFSIYYDLSDDKICNNVNLVVVKVNLKCTYRSNIYIRFALSSLANLVFIKFNLWKSLTVTFWHSLKFYWYLLTCEVDE